MYNTCPFLPRILQKQKNTSQTPQECCNINYSKITTKYPTRHQPTQRTIPKQTNHQKTNGYCPHIQMVLNKQRSRNWFPLRGFPNQRGCFATNRNRHVNFFIYRIIQRSATIPNQPKKLNQKKSFRSPYNNIQSHKQYSALKKIFMLQTLSSPWHLNCTVLLTYESDYGLV